MATPDCEPAPGYAGELASLTVLAEGPYTMGNEGPLTTTLRVPVERVGAGPRSARFDVIVRSPGKRPFSLNLGTPDPPWMLANHQPPKDLEGLIQDSHFLAQHVFAVAASTLALFESTLGRRMGWRGEGRLKLYVYDRVSYAATGYNRQECGIKFGHRRDRRMGRAVPLALFRDLVAHEVTHAILDGYRKRWADEYATLDELALHEAVADLVAMLSVFSSRDRVEQLLASQPGVGDPETIDERLLRSGLFRFADGLFTRGAARSPLDGDVDPDWCSFPSPHRRAEMVVRTVLNVVLRLWMQRLDKPGGRSSLYQVASAGADVGHRVLTMLIRGLGYMPPVDVTWEDLLRGILAADRVLVPDDPLEYRCAVRAAFAEVGITTMPDEELYGLGGFGTLRYPIRLAALGSDPEEVMRFLWENPSLLKAAGIDDTHSIVVERVRPSTRVSPDGFVVSEIGASFVQQFAMTAKEARKVGLGGHGSLMVRGGGLIRFDEGGHLCYAALKPVLDLERQRRRLAMVKTERESAAVLAPHTRRVGARALLVPRRSQPSESATFHPAGMGR
ncbi:UNVERIFIED_ORG: hypothetical protein J2X79_004250 [Arthrobacter globiformis]|nr:hypothetical protein [Arthrobacter globiformis]